MLVAPALFAQSYTTTFPLTENPISEGHKWINGGTCADTSLCVGLDWKNVQTTPHFAFGTQTGNGTTYDDSTAIVAGAWGANQTVTAEVMQTQAAEMEIRLHTTIAPHSITGYEILCMGGPVMQVVRWEGPLGKWDIIGSGTTVCHPHDIFKGTIVNNADGSVTIQAFVNNALALSVTDSGANGPVFRTGSPGMGFFNDGGLPVTDNGFVNFTATATGQITSFPLTENPISDGGKWISGRAAGTGCFTAGAQCWGDVQTKPGLAFGTVTSSGCSGQVGQNCNDSTAVVAGSWAQNQTAEAVIFVSSSIAMQCCHEVELRLNTTISPHSITGYEINCSVSGQSYLQLVRWNGPIGQFTFLNGGGSINCKNGDKLKAVRTGGAIAIYLNDALVSTTNETTYLGGAPGMGFFVTGDSNYANFGFSQFTGTGTSTTVKALQPPSLSPVTVQ